MGRASLFRRLTDTNVCVTGSVKIRKTRHKIAAGIRIFFYSVAEKHEWTGHARVRHGGHSTEHDYQRLSALSRSPAIAKMVVADNGRRGTFIFLISVDLISSEPSALWPRPIRQDSATYFVVIGCSHGELGRFTASALTAAQLR